MPPVQGGRYYRDPLVNVAVPETRAVPRGAALLLCHARVNFRPSGGQLYAHHPEQSRLRFRPRADSCVCQDRCVFQHGRACLASGRSEGLPVAYEAPQGGIYRLRPVAPFRVSGWQRWREKGRRCRSALLDRRRTKTDSNRMRTRVPCGLAGTNQLASWYA